MINGIICQIVRYSGTLYSTMQCLGMGWELFCPSREVASFQRLLSIISVPMKLAEVESQVALL